MRLVDGGDVLEVGAGSGVFAADLLVALAAADRLPARYLILERSADLRARQQALLAERVPQYLERVQWLDRLPERRLRGVVFANELLDALPVHMFTLTEDGPQELYVALSQDEFHWQPVPCGTLLQGRVGAERRRHIGMRRAAARRLRLSASRVLSLATQRRHAHVPLSPPRPRQPLLMAGPAGHHRSYRFHRRGRDRRCGGAGRRGLHHARRLPARMWHHRDTVRV